MAMDRATQCVHAMDKFVVFVVLMVLSNHMVLVANAFHTRTRLVLVEPMVGAASDNVVQYAEQGDLRASKPQVLAQQAAAPLPTVQPTNFKLQFVDSIFQIPIATLKAVSQLVQTISSGITAQVTTNTVSASSPAKSTIALDSAAQPSSQVGVRGSTSTANVIKNEPVAAAAAAAATVNAVSESESAPAAPNDSNHSVRAVTPSGSSTSTTLSQ